MDGLQFDEQNNNSVAGSFSNPEEKGMAGMLVKWGIAKDYKTGEMILLVGALILIAISIYLFINNL